MKRALPLIMLFSCGVDLAVPDDTTVSCAADADCQGGKLCATRVGVCVTTIDDEPPRILGVDARSADGLRVVFSEPVLCAAVSDASAYVIAPPLAITVASGSNCADTNGFTSDAVLFTDPQAPGAAYVLSASAIPDQGGNMLADDGDSAPFAGFGQAPDPSPPGALSPVDAARALGSTQALVWTTRPGATHYIVDVATDAGFIDAIAGSPFLVAAPATSLRLSGLTDVTHYWRVRSDITAAAAVLTTHDFDVLVDTVYVACAGSGPCDESGIRNGSRTRPYASVQRALAAAAELATSLDVASPKVKVAARGAGGVYTGAVVVQWQSVQLLGGYDAAFTTRDPNASATVLEANGVVLVVNNLPSTVSTLIEGLTARSTRVGTAAITVDAASASLTLRNVAGRAPGSSSGVVAVSGGPAMGASFDACRFSTLPVPGNDTKVVSISSAAPTFRNTTVSFDTAPYDSAIAFSIAGPLPGDAVVEGGNFTLPDATNRSVGFDVKFTSPSSGRLVLRGLTLRTGAASQNDAVFLDGDVSLLVERSHLATSLVDEGGQRAVITTIPPRSGFKGLYDVAIRNSIIEAALCVASGCHGISVDSAKRFELTSSLVLTPGTPYSHPLVVSDSNPVVTNSVLATGSSDVSCIAEGARVACTMPIALHDNALVNCNGFSGRDTSGMIITASTNAELGALDNQPFVNPDCASGCGNSRVSNTRIIASALNSVFTDLDGPDNDPATLADNDYHVLAGADLFIRQGGLDSTANVCAPQGQTASCNVPTTDYYGDARSVPYAIGHDEVP